MVIGLRIGGSVAVEPRDMFIIKATNKYVKDTKILVAYDRDNLLFIDTDNLYVRMKLQSSFYWVKTIIERLAEEFKVPEENITYIDCRLNDVTIGYEPKEDNHD